MRHKWNIKLPNDKKGDYDVRKCSRCGCKRSTYFGMCQYVTSGDQMYNTAPECIDWEIENAKTID